jgi:uncharacterized protein (TIGR00251 family)
MFLYKTKQKALRKPVKITETKDGIVLEVTVRPKARQFRIAIESEEIVVFCTEEPTRGRVNKELVKRLSKLLHKEVVLVSGFASRQKRLLINDTDKETLEKALRQE